MRPATSDDFDALTRLLDAAFAPSGYESDLVNRLRARGKLIHEWVAEDDRGLAGVVCYSRAFRGDEVIGLHLAPLAVRPDVQGNGIGSQLIRASLAALAALPPAPGISPVFVLGNPDFYERFGFHRIGNPRCPFDPENAHFLAYRWAGNAEGGAFFEIGYEAEFLDESAI